MSKEIYYEGNGEIFLIKFRNLEVMKENMDIFDYVNIRIFCVIKDIINKVSLNDGVEKIFVI